MTAAPSPSPTMPAGFGAVVRHAGWSEFVAGARSGVLALIFLGLTSYLMMVLTHAGYLRQLGASDIPRNAPSLVYLMTSGDAFFLLFAWAWVFAQPIVRDRNAYLHELVLAAPVSLRGLLLGRFLGAVAVAVLLGASQIAGFLLAPVLEWFGAIPAGATAPAPWVALGWAWLVFILPSALGCGALYLIAGLRTRSVAGPFAVAGALVMCWMFAMIVLQDGRMDPFWSTVLDPSGFAEVKTQVHEWTPHEKSTALLALTPGLVVNRLLWCLLPLCWLAWVLRQVRRENLVLERPARPAPRTAAPAQPVASQAAAATRAPISIPEPARWLRAAASEAAWQCRQVMTRRGIWIAAAGLAILGVSGGFTHAVGHADGPMVPRPEMLAPVMLKMMYVLISLVAAGAAGMVARRDDTTGFGEMCDATPAPDAIRLVGRASAVFGLTALFALVPAVSALLVTALMAPHSFHPGLTIGYQLLVALPALLEMTAAMVLLHALIRPAGPAYAASMLVAFIFLVNHEVELTAYPPAEIGVPVLPAFSGLTGWAPWGERLLGADVWKLSLVVLMLALAGLVMPRGTDGRWRVACGHARRRLWGPIGAAALAAIAVLCTLGPWQHQRLIDEGGYRSWDVKLADDAAWEHRWLAQATAFSVGGGSIEITLEPAQRQARGVWMLQNVRAEGGLLHLETPQGFHSLVAQVNGQPAQTELAQDHASVALGACTAQDCQVELQWQVNVRGWYPKGAPAWMLSQGVWARAVDLAPRLGFDRDRILLAPGDRKALGLPPQVPALPAAAAIVTDGIAPAAPWRWKVAVGEQTLQADDSTGPLDFAAVWSPGAETTMVGAYTVLHDATRRSTATSVAADVEVMAQCVTRRMGQAPDVATIVQMPRQLGVTAVADRTLLLPEMPAWDVADAGPGRWLRRADIASALARRHITETAHLRAGAGAQVLAQGLAGAIGLLCVADLDGLKALSSLLEHSADSSTQALAASKVPVGAAETALSEGWYTHYGPLSLLSLVATMTPTQHEALLQAARTSGDAAAALRAAFPAVAQDILGAPRSADLQLTRSQGRPQLAGAHWTWHDGGWVANPHAPTVQLLLQTEAGLTTLTDITSLTPEQASRSMLAVPQLAYERAPKDNLLPPDPLDAGLKTGVGLQR